MNLTYKAIAMMCGFEVIMEYDPSFYPPTYYWYSRKQGRGESLSTPESAWEACCLDNGLVEKDCTGQGGPR